MEWLPVNSWLAGPAGPTGPKYAYPFRACHTLAGSCPLVGRYTMAGRYPGGACPFIACAAPGAGDLGCDEASWSAGCPASGDRATPLRRDPYLDAAAPPTPPAAAPMAAAPGSPPNANGKPKPAPMSGPGAANGAPAGRRNCGGGAAACTQVGGTDNPPNEGESPTLAEAKKSPSNPEPDAPPPPSVGPAPPSAGLAPPSAAPAPPSATGGVIAAVSRLPIRGDNALSPANAPKNPGRYR